MPASSKLLAACAAALTLFVSGCDDHSAEQDLSHGMKVPRHIELIQKVESGTYSVQRVPNTLFPGETVYITEITELFHYKEAYPWLIAAIESGNEEVSNAVLNFFYTSNTPCGITREALLEWYDVPENELSWTGIMWEPSSPTLTPEEVSPGT